MGAGRPRFLPYIHSGHLQHHRHTSYAALMFVMLLCGVLLTGFSLVAAAATPAVNPQSGSVGLTGTVPGPPPGQAATITTPTEGQHVTAIPITVAGVCSAGDFITITKNDVFAGVTTCTSGGTFSLQIDLFDGANRLIARTSDALGQFGPDSTAVNVVYDAPNFTVPGSATLGKQLFLETDTTVVGTSPGVSLTRSVTIVGGVGPYAVSWDWGDGKTSLVSQALEGPTSSSHAYDRPGTYRVIVRVTDNAGNAAFLQLVTVVNGAVSPLGATNGSGPGALPGELMAAWPLYLLALLMVGLFWLGELRQTVKLRRRGMLAR